LVPERTIKLASYAHPPRGSGGLRLSQHLRLCNYDTAVRADGPPGLESSTPGEAVPLSQEEVTELTQALTRTRDRLGPLTEVGLNDVAFHVDLTQQRKGLTTEKALNVIRREYIEYGRGLPLNVMFNTTGTFPNQRLTVAPGFGTATTSLNPRNIQLAAKIIF